MTSHWTRGHFPHQLSRIILLAGISATLVHVTTAQAKAVTGRVSDVTLYRGQAMVTRTLTIDGPKGATEIAVDRLPAQVVPQSLYAEGGDDVDVRAVRLRTRVVREEPRQDVREIEQRIESIQAAITLNSTERELLGKRTTYLDGVQAFVVKAAQTELSKGSLDAETLEKTTRFIFEQRKHVSTESQKLAGQALQLGRELALEQRRLAQLTTSSSKTVREAVLFLDKAKAGRSTVRLNYLVAGCGWSPSYTLRAGENRKNVRVDYNALVQQMTGEDWLEVNLTLSTASPALSSVGPGLAPFHVTLALAGAPNGTAQETKKYREQLKAIQGRRGRAAQAARIAQRSTETNAQSWNLNTAANDYQSLELTGSKDFFGILQQRDGGTENGPSLSYELPGAVSLASRADQQMVRVNQSTLPSEFYHVAQPVLTHHVFREAELTNNSPDGFLAGPTTVYLDGRFVGRSEIPTVARGERFVVGFGADSQLRTRRVLVDKEEKVQGGNREMNLEYRLIVENFKDTPMSVRVFDRLPFSEQDGQIRITLLDGEDRLSTDRLYVRDERPKWILRFDEEVAASASGENVHVVDYAYRAEFDRKFRIAAAGSSQQFQQEFMKLQRGRTKR